MKLHYNQTCLSIGMAVTLAVVSCWAMAGCDRAESGSSDAQQVREVPVEVVQVRSETLRETVRGIGTLRAAETVEIKPEVDGFIREIHFKEGGEVEAGQLLFSVDDRKLKHSLAATTAALKAARVRLADAQRRLNRVLELMEQRAADQDELDAVETDFQAGLAEVARMEAEVELAQAKLDDTRLHAPFDGFISERRIDAGDYVNAGDHLATLYRVSRMEIAFTLPERFMGRVRVGQEVAVTVSAYPDRRFAGDVCFVSPQVDESTRDLLVKAAVKNPEGLLKPGAFGTAVVILEVREQQPVIPEEALVATRGGYIVFVVEGQVAKRREVRNGLREAGVVEILKGLKLGERIVRAGHMNLSDGDRVRIVEDDKQRDQQGQPQGAQSDEE